MTKQELDIRTLMDVPLWEQVQDQLAKLTGTAIICVDVNGVPVSKSSGQTDFCRVMRQNPVTRKRCYRCDALAGLEALRLERPYIYLCHCGIVDVAIPVLYAGKYIGAVLFGQVRVPHDEADVKLQRLMQEINSFSAADETVCRELKEMFERLPEMSYSAIERIAQLINSIVKYIVERVTQFYDEKRTFEWMLSFRDKQNIEDTNIQELTVPKLELTAAEEDFPVSSSSAIYPALSYIQSHLRESITMKDMATLCHLSPSYFSRLFGREIGENFVSYVNRKKIQLAKELLRETNKNVSMIASELSYQDSSHFINLFKRFEGITPQVYRQYNYR